MTLERTESDTLRHIVERYSRIVDERLLAIVKTEPVIPNLHDGMIYSLGLDLDDTHARGKRLRPVLCLATAEALGARVEHALDFACAIELMHNFALVHDDIEDGDETRRDRPTVWKKFGQHHGINIGDYLLCKVYSTLTSDNGLPLETRHRLIALMTDTLDHTIVGQTLDMNARGNGNFTHDDYFRLAREKTSYYLAAPMVGGAIAANATSETVDALTEFGHLIGPLFQITDDMLDLTRGKGRGGMIGSDIREGKRSFLVAEANALATAEEKLRLYEILDRPRTTTSEADVEWAVQLFSRYNIIGRAQQYCDGLLEKALAILRTVPAPVEGILSLFARQISHRER